MRTKTNTRPQPISSQRSPAQFLEPAPELPRYGFEIEEVAEMLHCGRTTVFDLIKKWKIKTFATGRKTLISPWELERAIREQERVA